MSTEWKKSLTGKNKNHASSGANIDSLFRENKSQVFSTDVVSEDQVDFDSIERRSMRQSSERLRAAKMLDAYGVTSGGSLPFGRMPKTANFGGGGAGGNVEIASATDMYSPWLSTDYLELPRSYSEERRWYRFFYDQDPLVGRAIDLKTFIPLSKMSVSIPKSRSHKYAQQVHSFFEQQYNELGMYEKLTWVLHEYNLIGEALIYFEWDSKGKRWSKILILDPDVVEVRYMPYQDETRVFITPDNSIRETIGDLRDNQRYSELADTMEQLSDDAALESDVEFLELNTDPMKGSFVKYFGRKRSPYRPGPGVSILRRLLRTLLFRDKLRQALTQITSRHMTPVRLVWAENLAPEELDELRSQVDLAIMGPDYSIITNYELHWEEVTAEGRLFDASAVFEQTTEELLIGLGMTKELLTGEGSYGGGRITLQVLDTEFSLVRELLQEMINELFRVVAAKNDFKETDPETGMTYLVYSTLKFSRMSLRDYSDIFDFLWNLYQGGTLDKETLLEFMNIDSKDVENKLRANAFTINDNLADEFRRAVYSEAAGRIIEETDVLEKLREGFSLEAMKGDEIPADDEEAPPEEGAPEAGADEGAAPAEGAAPEAGEGEQPAGEGEAPAEEGGEKPPEGEAPPEEEEPPAAEEESPEEEEEPPKKKKRRKTDLSESPAGFPIGPKP
jgi:hypothetical protein